MQRADGWLALGVPIVSMICSVAACAAEPVEFRGMCDASAATRLGSNELVVASDEDNVLRVYSLDGGSPQRQLDVSEFLGTRKESDIEGAAALGDRIYWITSHGRKKNGTLTRDRQKLFAVDAKGLEPIASARASLLRALARIDDLRGAIGEDQKDVDLAPKKMGINIEGLARSAKGETLLVGFRNPRPNGRALIVPLDDPAAVVAGAEPALGAPIRVDLGGRGIRALHYLPTRDTFLIVAGPRDEPPPGFQLYAWPGPGTSTATPLAVDVPADLTPEAVVASEDGSRILLISDDGSRRVRASEAQCDEDFEASGSAGTCPCKRLADPSRQRFRARWVALP